ncbi:TonB-dependent receptor [Halarcobacter sp.]|uniref:TonB-dependent receptor plug domain-containing protein n=1 Tax=Halarcobacter sp. TaxID=2321133 RepID=UPI0029F52902|nr:TonB-dependent receptor [Halarcobacter sp.]
MNKKILISLATSAVLISSIYADTTSLGEITVTTATKTEKSIDGVTASVVVVTQEEIEKTGASTLDKILEKIPSINAQYARFPHPSSKSKASISLRGVGANGTLILIDGKRLSGETESPYEMTRITASMIERIEIVKGSMSTLYGSDAIGGVINIITKKIDKNETTIDIKYGSNGDGEAKNKNVNFITRAKVGTFKYKIYGNINDTTPYSISKSYSQVATNPSTGSAITTDAQHGVTGVSNVTYRDESTTKTIGTRFENDFSDNLKVGIDVNYFKENREGEYIGTAKYINSGTPILVKNTPVSSEDKNSRLDVSLDLEYFITEKLSLDTNIYRSYYKKRNYTNPINFTGPTNTKFSANVTIDGIESNLKYELNDLNFITSGIEYRKEKRESSAINPDPSSSEFITKVVKYKALFIQDEIVLNDTLNATIGARYDNISNADNKTTFQAGLVQKLGENTSLRANYAQGYRAPDIAELYVVSPSYKDGKRFGAEVIYGPKTTAYDLKPEESQTFELSLSNKYNDLSSQLTLFNTTVKDKIELVSYNDGTAAKYYTSENLDEVVIKGIEASFSYIFNDSFDLSLDATYLKTKDKSTGNELMYTPNISASIGANYQITKEFSSNLNFRYIGKQFTNSTNTTKANNYNLVDLGARYNINKHLQFYAGIDNIFDKKIEEELGTNVGRYFYTGIRVSF